MPSKYNTADAFRRALEDRLKTKAQKDNIDLMRLRRTVAFERFLARLFVSQDPPWLLKGGYAMELRLHRKARATKDIDLSVPNIRRLVTPEVQLPEIEVIREKLQDAAQLDLEDWFVFRIGEAMQDLDNAPYGGARYPIETLLANRDFVSFHIDVGVGDVIISEPEWIVGEDILSFAEIPPSRMAAISREQQFAEKVHAYTLPRGERVNSRVKDLVDLLLLIDLGLPDKIQVEKALQSTFQRRQTHEQPSVLDFPPQSWKEQYESLAKECGFVNISIEDGFTQVANFWISLKEG